MDVQNAALVLPDDLLGEKAFAILEGLKAERGREFAESMRRGLIDTAAKMGAEIQNAIEKGGERLKQFLARALVATSPLSLAIKALDAFKRITGGATASRAAAMPVRIVDFLEVSPSRMAFGLGQRIGVAQKVQDVAALIELKGIRTAILEKTGAFAG